MSSNSLTLFLSSCPKGGKKKTPTLKPKLEGKINLKPLLFSAPNQM
jgi:hypothetical protein